MNPFSRIIRRRTSLLLVTAVLYLTAWAIKVLYGGHYTAPVGFGCAAPRICFAGDNARLLPETAAVYRSGGYDGQFYYYIAASLYSGESVRVDAAMFRLSRIGFPILAGPAFLISPTALVLSLTLIPLFFHLISVHFASSMLGARLSVLYAYALNPFSLLSFLLNVSDGLALSLAVVGITLYRGSRYRPEALRAGMLALGFIAFSFAILSKETFLAVSAAFAGAQVLAILIDRRAILRRIANLFFWIGTAIPLLFWWLLIRFSPGRMTEHGGAPFTGYIDYISNADALLSGRTLTAIIYIIYMIVFVILLYQNMTMIRSRMRIDRTRIAAALILFFDIVLISFATDEYWGNFPNIARLFTPGVLAPLLLSRRGEEGTPLIRFMTLLLLVTFLLVSFRIVRNETLVKKGDVDIVRVEDL
jgi:hypothetical protein